MLGLKPGHTNTLYEVKLMPIHAMPRAMLDIWLWRPGFELFGHFLIRITDSAQKFVFFLNPFLRFSVKKL